MNAAYGLTFHHFGLAVEKPDLAVHFLTGLGYRIGEVIHDRYQNVNLMWGESDAMPAVEIIFPTDTPGPLDEILRRNKELVYHLCFVSENLEVSLQQMRGAGHRIVGVVPPKPAPLFHDDQVSFYLIRGFGLIEIIEKSPGRSIAVQSQPTGRPA